MCVYLFCPLRDPRSSDIPETMRIPTIQILVSKFSTKKTKTKKNYFRKLLIPGLEQRKDKNEPEIPCCPKAKKCAKNDGQTAKGYTD